MSSRHRHNYNAYPPTNHFSASTAASTSADPDQDSVNLRASIRKECDDLLRDLDWVLGHDQSPHPPRGSADDFLATPSSSAQRYDDGDDLLLSQLDQVLADDNHRASPAPARGRENRIPARAFHDHQPPTSAHSKPSPSPPPPHLTRSASAFQPRTSPSSRHFPTPPPPTRPSTAAPMAPMYFMPAVPAVPKIREPSVLYGPRHADSPTMVIERQSDEVVRRYFASASAAGSVDLDRSSAAAGGGRGYGRPR